jgi:hypothetical protein
MRRFCGSRYRAATGLAAACLAIGALTAGLAGCQQFFTSSLAKGLARDSLTLPSNLTASQATDLAAEAKANDDKKLASALVTNLVDKIANTTDPGTKAELQGAAATAAIVASGTSSSLTGVIADYTSGTPVDIVAVVQSIQAGGSGTGVVEALKYLDPATGLSAAQAKESGLGATDLAMAAVVIAAQQLPIDPATSKPIDPSTMTPAEVTAFQAQPDVQVAINILNEAQSIVTPGSDSAKLLNDMASRFSLPAPPP